MGGDAGFKGLANDGVDHEIRNETGGSGGMARGDLVDLGVDRIMARCWGAGRKGGGIIATRFRRVGARV